MAESGQKLQIEKANKFQLRKPGFLKYLFLGCFFLLTTEVTAPGLSVSFKLVIKHVDNYERLINAIIMVESAGNSMAYNQAEEARGAFQIRPIRLKDYNQRTGKNYTTEDCFNFEISKEIFLYYVEKNGNPDYQFIARRWNGSGRMTLDYWEKVKKHLELESISKEIFYVLQQNYHSGKTCELY